MRGRSADQGSFIRLIDIERRIPHAHPSRRVKALVDEVLGLLDERLEALCERLKYDVLFQWFLNTNMEEAEDACFDASVFANNQERIVGADIGGEFFAEVVGLAQKHGWVSDGHFSVDGTLIDAWASMKSFRPKDEPKEPGDSNGWSDFKGEKRSNATHESKTDPEARLLRKGRGTAAKLRFAMHATMDNRNGLCVVLGVHPSVGKTETTAALEQLDKLKERGFEPRDPGSRQGLSQQGVRGGLPRARSGSALRAGEKRKVDGLDARTTSKGGYRARLIVRRRIEQIFGWAKTMGGLRNSRPKGVTRVHANCQYVGSAYNLLRMARLSPSAQSPPLGVAGA